MSLEEKYTSLFVSLDTFSLRCAQSVLRLISFFYFAEYNNSSVGEDAFAKRHIWVFKNWHVRISSYFEWKPRLGLVPHLDYMSIIAPAEHFNHHTNGTIIDAGCSVWDHPLPAVGRHLFSFLTMSVNLMYGAPSVSARIPRSRKFVKPSLRSFYVIFKVILHFSIYIYSIFP